MLQKQEERSKGENWGKEEVGECETAKQFGMAAFEVPANESFSRIIRSKKIAYPKSAKSHCASDLCDLTLTQTNGFHT